MANKSGQMRAKRSWNDIHESFTEKSNAKDSDNPAESPTKKSKVKAGSYIGGNLGRCEDIQQADCPDLLIESTGLVGANSENPVKLVISSSDTPSKEVKCLQNIEDGLNRTNNFGPSNSEEKGESAASNSADIFSGVEYGVKTVKKVRLCLKNNIVWNPEDPLPPQSLRLPPSAIPRGSALKKTKDVPAGPIIKNWTWLLGWVFSHHFMWWGKSKTFQ